MRFPEFSGEWEMSSIGEQFELYSGNTPSRMNKNQFDGSINWITSGELKEHYISDTKEKISEEAAKNNSLKLLPVGTFVIAIYGLEANGVRGTCSITTRESTISQACMAFTSKMDIQNEFLYSWYKKHGNIIGIKYAQGTKQQNLSYDIIERFNISYPCMEEQKKLIRFISLIDQRIATQNKIIEKLQSLIKGLNNTLQYDTGGKSVCLGDILLERSERSQTNNQHEVLSSTVKGIFSQREYFSKDIASENNVGYKIIRLHDVVLSPQNLWMGNINYNDRFEIGIVSPSYKVFSIADGYDNQFVAAMLKTHRALYSYMMVSEQGASIVRRNLNMEAFSQLVFKIPSLDKQREIGYAISLLKSQLKTANKIIKAYTSQKQYLLRQMFI
ncbi:restriction endonuclease subunit S [Bacteroides finegoldii]|uniref:Putative type I restriction-modification system specificity system n=1 Tax=Bacteroides finegoldii TaxID=338188 RepID=A0A174GBB6_9BACE|nr:restriction endonuclease subunit S [Bacteroides finegoldii]CUO57765.1 putative type I restriction-modification system specificity system [Bacteroides finegoldii]